MPGKGRQHLRADGGEQGIVAPRRGGDEVVQRLMQAGRPGWIEARRHRLDALALAGQKQTRAIADEPLRAVGMAEHRRQAGEVFLQALFAGRGDRIAHALSYKANF